MVLNILKADLTNLEMNTTKPRREGDRYYVHIKEKSGDRLVFQTCKLRALSNIEGGFLETTTENKTFCERIKYIDEVLLDYVKEKKDEWFPGKDIKDTFLENGQMHSIRERKSKSEYAFTLRTCNEMIIFDNEKNKLALEDGINAGTDIVLIMELTGIWFTATRWGASWKIIQLKKVAPKQIVDECLFDESDSDDDQIHPPPGLEM